MNTQDQVIRIENLTKTYQMGEVEVHALRGVSFTVDRGEVLAIMGPSGSGKSTLMNMIGCLDNPSTGDYYLEGELVSSLKDDELALVRNRNIGFVFQKFNLLARATALANVELPLRYAGKNGNRSELARQALEAVGLGDRVTHQPNELSGGQKQRLAIARAILKDAPILLLDEATSALDGETEYLVKGALDELMKNKTTLVIAHRLSTIQNADLIVVIDNGRIVQKGKHEDLILQKGLYQKLNGSVFIADIESSNTVGA